MVKTNNVELVDVVSAIGVLKTLVGGSQDGAVVGIDSVSGDDYFQTMPCVGTIYIGKDNLHRIIVDALAYPAHVGDSGKKYADENRFITVAFNPETLMILPNTRRNSGFKTISTCKVLSIDPFTWVAEQQKKIADAKAKADQARKKLDMGKVANARTSALANFVR